MGALRFFFIDRFNRFDAAVIVLAAYLHGQHRVGFVTFVAILLVGFALSSVGELAREKREQRL